MKSDITRKISLPRKIAISSRFEALIGIFGGLIVYLLPHLVKWAGGLGGALSDYFISDPKLTSAVAFCVAAIGALLSISRKAIETNFQEDTARMNQLADIVDLSGNAHFSELHTLISVYQRITDREFDSIKHEIIMNAKGRLAKMAFNQESPPLPASMFGSAETAKLQEKRGSKVKVRALSTLFDGDFDLNPTAEEQMFIRANVDLVASGGDFERIFVFRSDDYEINLRRPSVALHAMKNSQIPGRVVFIETLQKQDPDLMRSIEYGFLVFGNEVAFIDRPSHDKFLRGVIVTHPDRLREIHQLYDHLRTYSYSFSDAIHPATGEPIHAVPLHSIAADNLQRPLN